MTQPLLAYSSKNAVQQAGSPDIHNALAVFALSKHNIAEILDLQSVVHDQVKNSFQRIFLKKRDADDYINIIETGGLVLGIKKEGQLIASACVNNALDKGRVEITINSQFNHTDIGVFQGSMVHPDFRGHDCANGLYIHRALWAMRENKKQLFASACSQVHNPENNETHPGNVRVINALQSKGWTLTDEESNIKDDGLNLTISNLRLTLPETQEALYTHFNTFISPEIVQKWVHTPLLKLG